METMHPKAFLVCKVSYGFLIENIVVFCLFVFLINIEILLFLKGGLLRPIVEDTLFPSDENEMAILKMIMESCWSENPIERPPFAYSLEVLELITPLKGSHTAKRAILLERETESLEKYIGHDTMQIFREQEKFQDLLARMLPLSIASELNEKGSVKPVYHENITVMAVRVSNFGDVLSNCNTNDAIDVINYLWGAISVITKNRKLNITEINNRGDFVVLGKYGDILYLYFYLQLGSKLANMGYLL